MLCSHILYASDQPVENYRPVRLHCESNKNLKLPGTFIVAIRQFVQNNQTRYLLVEAQTLRTRLVAAADYNCVEADPQLFSQTYYARILGQASVDSDRLANTGIKNFMRDSVVISVDMCPSRRAYEKRLFDWLEQNKQAFSVAFTAGWASRHGDEFQHLKAISEANQNVTWVNHSYHHPYQRDLGLEGNFLLLPGVDLEQEVLGNEVFMIENGLTPSVFFRFPGLVSSAELISKISDWGLVTLGSDAWLAKGERPQAGSVILLHGNGNEPQGITLFFRWLDQILSLGVAALP